MPVFLSDGECRTTRRIDTKNRCYAVHRVGERLIGLWPVKVLLIILFIWFAKFLFSIEMGRFVGELLREFKELLTGQWTSRSINALAIIVVFASGIVTIFVTEVPEFVSLISQVISEVRAIEFKESANPLIVFVMISLVATFSVWIAIRGSRR